MSVCCSLSLLVGTTWVVVDGSAQNGGGGWGEGGDIVNQCMYTHTYIHTFMQQHQLHKHAGPHMHKSTHTVRPQGR